MIDWLKGTTGPQRLAMGLAGAGIIGLIAVLMSTGSVRGYVKDHYRRAGSENGAQVYLASKPPAKVGAEIQKAHEPADRRVTSEGIFLRYRKDFVGILPRGRGSKIVLANENRGYGLFYPYVGGYWGSYSGPGESFRGGGPGSGK